MTTRDAERPDDTGLVVLATDLARFTEAGYGTIRDIDLPTVTVGERIGVTDVDADTVEAEVAAVGTDSVDVRAWCGLVGTAC